MVLFMTDDYMDSSRRMMIVLLILVAIEILYVVSAIYQKKRFTKWNNEGITAGGDWNEPVNSSQLAKQHQLVKQASEEEFNKKKNEEVVLDSFRDDRDQVDEEIKDADEGKKKVMEEMQKWKAQQRPSDTPLRDDNNGENAEEQKQEENMFDSPDPIQAKA